MARVGPRWPAHILYMMHTTMTKYGNSYTLFLIMRITSSTLSGDFRPCQSSMWRRSLHKYSPQ